MVALREWGRSESGEYPRLNAKDPAESVLTAAENWKIPVACDHTRVDELIVRFGDVEGLDADDTAGQLLRVHVRWRTPSEHPPFGLTLRLGGNLDTSIRR